MSAAIHKGTRSDLAKAAEKLFKGGGQIAIDGPTFNSPDDFIAALDDSDNINESDAASLLQAINDLNFLLDSTKLPNQYIPQDMKGKCPKLKVTSSSDGVNLSVKWW